MGNQEGNMMEFKWPTAKSSKKNVDEEESQKHQERGMLISVTGGKQVRTCLGFDHRSCHDKYGCESYQADSKMNASQKVEGFPTAEGDPAHHILFLYCRPKTNLIITAISCISFSVVKMS